VRWEYLPLNFKDWFTYHRNRPEYIELLDKGILTVNQSYLQIQREKRKEIVEVHPLLEIQIQKKKRIGDFIRNHLMI
jgi:hypothetical protein